MEKQKLCPLTKTECLEECGWYVNGLNECAINTLAQAVDSIANIFEKKEFERVQK